MSVVNNTSIETQNVHLQHQSVLHLHHFDWYAYFGQYSRFFFTVVAILAEFLLFKLLRLDVCHHNRCSTIVINIFRNLIESLFVLLDLAIVVESFDIQINTNKVSRYFCRNPFIRRDIFRHEYFDTDGATWTTDLKKVFVFPEGKLFHYEDNRVIVCTIIAILPRGQFDAIINRHPIRTRKCSPCNNKNNEEKQMQHTNPRHIHESKKKNDLDFSVFLVFPCFRCLDKLLVHFNHISYLFVFVFRFSKNCLCSYRCNAIQKGR